MSAVLSNLCSNKFSYNRNENNRHKSVTSTKDDFTGARDSEWQWHQLGHMQVCTSLQTYNHASTSLLSFLQVDLYNGWKMVVVVVVVTELLSSNQDSICNIAGP